jgi:leader peptidase (prepilin peptidase) / N-methyltransferase
MMADASMLTLITVMGLAIGSFLNVVIHRLPRGMSLLTPPSTCPRCQKRLRAIDNIPVLSWLLLRGRCHNCGLPISVQYPLVEAITGALFLLVALFTPIGPALIAQLLLVAILVALFGIDLHHQILPNVITLPGIVVGFLFSLVGPPGWVDSLIGIALGAGILYGIAAAYYAVRREEGLGMGDVKMLAMIGAFLGWKAVLVTLMLATFSGAIVGVGIIAVSRGDMKLALPFGTFLALGAVAAMLFGDPLIAWYAGFFVP